MKLKPNQFILCLENIRDPGVITLAFRLVFAFHFKRLLLAGYTLKPPHPQLSSLSPAIQKNTYWLHSTSIAPLLSPLQQDGFHMIALDPHLKGKSLFRHKLLPKSCFIFGNPLTGLSHTALGFAQHRLSLDSTDPHTLSLDIALPITVALAINQYHYQLQ